MKHGPLVQNICPAQTPIACNLKNDHVNSRIGLQVWTALMATPLGAPACSVALCLPAESKTPSVPWQLCKQETTSYLNVEGNQRTPLITFFSSYMISVMFLKQSAKLSVPIAASSKLQESWPPEAPRPPPKWIQMRRKLRPSIPPRQTRQPRRPRGRPSWTRPGRLRPPAGAVGARSHHREVWKAMRSEEVGITFGSWKCLGR